MRKVSELVGKNIVVYDLEIKKPIEECKKGWAGHDEMGISVGCAFDYRTCRYRVFMDDNIKELVERLNESGTLVVAFNHIGFDNVLLRASGLPLRPDKELNNYDMLLKSRKGAGVGAARSPGFKLDDHLETLGLPMKTANGAMAPIMWQQKRYGELIDYCVADVQAEKKLFEHFWVHGQSATKFKPTPYDIERPEI